MDTKNIENRRFIGNCSFPYNVYLEDLINTNKELINNIDIRDEAYDKSGNLLVGSISVWINENIEDDQVFYYKQFYYAELREFEKFPFVQEFQILTRNISDSFQFEEDGKESIYIRGYINTGVAMSKEKEFFVNSNHLLVKAIKDHYKRIYDLLKQDYYNKKGVE